MSKTNSASTGKILKNFPKYEIYSHGAVVSRKTGNSLASVLDTNSPTVRIFNRNGKRVRVSVAKLVEKAFG